MDYMAGCAMKYGMPCTCGPSCRCKNCPVHSGNGANVHNMNPNDAVEAHAIAAAGMGVGDPLHVLEPDPLDEEPLHVDQKMDFFGMEPPSAVPRNSIEVPHHHQPPAPPMISETHQMNHDANALGPAPVFNSRRSQRNPSIISYGGLRNMSINSETTFGRAMSGLSALSIDWENLEDFDVEVDHSAHINNQGTSPMGGNRRSSVRRSFAAPNQGQSGSDQESHVSFKV